MSAASCRCGGVLQHFARVATAEFYQCRRCGQVWRWGECTTEAVEIEKARAKKQIEEEGK